MTQSPSKWADLTPRLASAVVLAAVGLGAVWAGGIVFGVFTALAVGLIAWEITRMLAPGKDALAHALGVIVGAVILLAGYLPGLAALMLIFVAVIACTVALAGKVDRNRFGLYILWVMIAGYALTAFRTEFGLTMILWLVAVVVVTDIMGYFAGRILGGPKFWPRVSPKKTWSGTIAGWLGALLVGLAFANSLGGWTIWLSPFLSFASQMGDAAESALKRHTGIKDSSHLIPGHGGVFDRFDAMMGAGLCLFLAYLFGFFGG